MTTIRKKKSGRPTKRPDAELLDMLYKKYTARQIANMYDVSTKTVQGWIYQYRRQADIDKALAE